MGRICKNGRGQGCVKWMQPTGCRENSDKGSEFSMNEDTKAPSGCVAGWLCGLSTGTWLHELWQHGLASGRSCCWRRPVAICPDRHDSFISTSNYCHPSLRYKPRVTEPLGRCTAVDYHFLRRNDELYTSNRH